jgi:hypothetical protein
MPVQHEDQDKFSIQKFPTYAQFELQLFGNWLCSCIEKRVTIRRRWENLVQLISENGNGFNNLIAIGNNAFSKYYFIALL